MILEARNISVHYGQAIAVADVSLGVARGAWVAVLGPNGAGKSSLLKAIVGLVRHGGSVVIEGQDVSRLKAWERHARGLGYVPEGRQLFRDMSVEENLRVGGYSLSQGELVCSLDEVFQLFPRLADRRRQISATLSGGEQQMLALGRALMTRPKLLLVDEISWGLSPLLVEQVFAALSQLHAAGLSILQVEQSAHDALAHSDSACIMATGTITHRGSTAELKRDESLIENYLG